MAKLDLDNVASGYNRQRINTNFEKIEQELQNKVLYRDNPAGEPNQMENDLDMNSNDINNVNTIRAEQIRINGKEVVEAVILDEQVQINKDAIEVLDGRVDQHDVDIAERVISIDSVADLSGFVGAFEGQQVSVKGRGIFYWDSARSGENDGLFVIDGWVSVDARADLESKKDFGLVSDKSRFAARLGRADYLGQKVVWVGDSITEQGKSGTGNGIGYTTYLEQLFPGAAYVNEGIGGNTTLDIISRLPTIESHSADVYVVAIGVNDVRYNDARGAIGVSQYIANITTIYNSLIAAGGEVMFIGIWPTFWQDQFAALLRAETDRRMTQYNNSLRSFCRSNGIIFVDPNPAIRSAIDFANVEFLIPDGVHPDYTRTEGKRLYADSLLIDNPRREDYSANLYANGKLFFKFVFGANGQPDGFLGLKNIAINGTNFQEAFGDTANLGFPFDVQLYGSFKPAFIGYYNKPNDFPLITTVGVDAWPSSVVLSGMVTSAVGNRGARRFETWFSTDPESVSNPSHPSWVLWDKSEETNGIAVNILPRTKNRFYYQLRFTTGTTVNLKRIATSYPIRVGSQNLLSTSQQRYDLIFGTGAGVVGDALAFSVPNGLLMWEADSEENEFTLESFDSSLAGFTIFQSTDPAAMGNVIHESWVPVVTASGDGTYFVPRMKPAEYIGESVATDVAGLRAVLNDLTAKLRAANIIKPNP